MQVDKMYGCPLITFLTYEDRLEYPETLPPTDIHGTVLRKRRTHRGHRQGKKRKFGKFPRYD